MNESSPWHPAKFATRLLDSAGEGIVVFDHELRYRIWNRFMEDRFGLCFHKGHHAMLVRLHVIGDPQNGQAQPMSKAPNPLTQTVMLAQADAEGVIWSERADLEGLPSVFLKVARQGLSLSSEKRRP